MAGKSWSCCCSAAAADGCVCSTDQTLPCLWQRREASADVDLPEKDKEIRAKVEIRHLQTHFHHEAYRRKFFDADIWRQMQAQE